jgi:hypothetical protein
LNADKKSLAFTLSYGDLKRFLGYLLRNKSREKRGDMNGEGLW